jgi:hypothetical protein
VSSEVIRRRQKSSEGIQKCSRNLQKSVRRASEACQKTTVEETVNQCKLLIRKGLHQFDAGEELGFCDLSQKPLALSGSAAAKVS